MPPPRERCSHLLLFTSPHLLFTLISVPPFACRMSSLCRFLFMFCSLERKPNSLIRFFGPRGHERLVPRLFEESQAAMLLLLLPPSVSKILQSPGFFSQMLKSRLHVQPFVWWWSCCTISELISERSCSVLAFSARSSSCWILWGSHSDLLGESCSCLCRRGWTLSPSCCIWFLYLSFFFSRYSLDFFCVLLLFLLSVLSLLFPAVGLFPHIFLLRWPLCCETSNRPGPSL